MESVACTQKKAKGLMCMFTGCMETQQPTCNALTDWNASPTRCGLQDSLNGDAGGLYLLLGLNAISPSTAAIPETSFLRGAYATCSFKSMSRKQRVLYAPCCLVISQAVLLLLTVLLSLFLMPQARSSSSLLSSVLHRAQGWHHASQQPVVVLQAAGASSSTRGSGMARPAAAAAAGTATAAAPSKHAGGKHLMIVESPTKANKIQKFLGDDYKVGPYLQQSTRTSGSTAFVATLAASVAAQQQQGRHS